MYFSLFPSRSHRSILFFDSRVAVSLPLRRACAEFPLLSSSRSIHRSRLENERDTKVYVTFFLSLFVHFLEKLRSCGNRGKSRRRRRRRQVKVKTGWLAGCGPLGQRLGHCCPWPRKEEVTSRAPATESDTHSACSSSSAGRPGTGNVRRSALPQTKATGRNTFAPEWKNLPSFGKSGTTKRDSPPPPSSSSSFSRFSLVLLSIGLQIHRPPLYPI